MNGCETDEQKDAQSEAKKPRFCVYKDKIYKLRK